MAAANNQFKYLTMQQIESLVALVEEGNFSRAAKKLLLTQPSLSKHIKNLEDLSAAKVIHRTSSGLSLTDEGKILYEYAKKMLKLRDEAGERMALAKDTASGNIFVGASTIPATYILPYFIKDFQGKYPDIKVHIYSGDTQDIVDMVVEGRSEIGFVGKQPSNKKLACESLWEDTLVLVVSKNHPWANKKSVDLNLLMKEPFVMREQGSGTRAVLEDYVLKSTGRMFSPKVVCAFGSSEAVKEAVIAGLGITIISLHAVKREIRQGNLVRVPIQNFHLKRHFYLIHKKHTHMSQSQQLFLDFVVAYRIH